MPIFRSFVIALLLGTTGCTTVHRGAVDSAAPSRALVPAGGERLSDAQVVGVALLVNNVEIAAALLANERASDADVIAYAARMRTDHTSLNGTLTDLLARLDLDAEEAPAGVALRESSFPRRARLARLRGSAFDAAYVADDLTSHHELLDLVDRVLVPNAARRELREYLAALRPALAAHLAHAEQLAATLAARQR